MERKTWVKPMTLVQKFEANETVAACWGVACMVSEANDWEWKNDFWNAAAQKHEAEHCGTIGNQVIFDDNDDGIADRMIETGVSGGGTLPCTIYTDDSFSEIKSIGSVKVGEKLYWTTSKKPAAITYTWHHRGMVVQQDPNHPNRS